MLIRGVNRTATTVGEPAIAVFSPTAVAVFTEAPQGSPRNTIRGDHHRARAPRRAGAGPRREAAGHSLVADVTGADGRRPRPVPWPRRVLLHQGHRRDDLSLHDARPSTSSAAGAACRRAGVRPTGLAMAAGTVAGLATVAASDLTAWILAPDAAPLSVFAASLARLLPTTAADSRTDVDRRRRASADPGHDGPADPAGAARSRGVLEFRRRYAGSDRLRGHRGRRGARRSSSSCPAGFRPSCRRWSVPPRATWSCTS